MQIKQELSKLDKSAIETKSVVQKVVEEKTELTKQNISHKNINLTDILKNLFNEVITKQKTNKVLLETIKNLPAFKSFQNFSTEIKELIKQLEIELPKSKQIEQLKSTLTDIKQVDAKVLEKGVAKSGVFLESYLKNFMQTSNKSMQENIKAQIFDDIKTILTSFESSESVSDSIKIQANKMVTQIEYYQLLSYLNNSNFTYLPFDWNELEDGDIEFKKDDKDEHTCHINLSLKHYGKLKINIIYADGNFLSLGFFPEQSELKEKLQENLPLLRKMMKNIQMNLVNISIIENTQTKQDPNLAKFNQFKNDDNFRIDIRV
jgi:flagellar hook-length control protein FliK